MIVVLNFELMQKGSVVCLRDHFIIGESHQYLVYLVYSFTHDLSDTTVSLCSLSPSNNGLFALIFFKQF